MITVLTATRGTRPDMLAEAVDSVRAQTHTNWEHVIVDDGSYSVPEIERTRVLRVSHRGPGPARNAGLEVARGEAVALIDDDDLWYPHHLETVWNAMQETGADVVYANCDETGRRDGYAVTVRPFDGELLQQENFICVLSALVRTEALRRAGGFPGGALEDWGLWRRMHELGMAFHYVDSKTVQYRFHDDNLTYGGADPDRTRAAKELREQAEAGRISWEEYEARLAEVWA